MVDLGGYLLGVAQLALVVVPIGFSAYRLRGRLLPGWEGAPARLVESIVGVAIVIWLSEILGTFGLFHAGALIVAALLVAGTVAFWPAGPVTAGDPPSLPVAKASSGMVPPTVPPTGESAPVDDPPPAEEEEAEPETSADPAPPTGSAGHDGLSLEEIQRVWPAVLQKLSETVPALAATLEGARPVSFGDEGLEVGFPPEMTFNKKKADSPERRDTVAAAFAAVTVVGLRPTYVLLDGEAPPDTPAPGSEEIDEEELLERLKSEFDAEEVS